MYLSLFKANKTFNSINMFRTSDVFLVCLWVYMRAAWNSVHIYQCLAHVRKVWSQSWISISIKQMESQVMNDGNVAFNCLSSAYAMLFEDMESCVYRVINDFLVLCLFYDCLICVFTCLFSLWPNIILLTELASKLHTFNMTDSTHW